jgi:hypothetical protein
MGGSGENIIFSEHEENSEERKKEKEIFRERLSSLGMKANTSHIHPCNLRASYSYCILIKPRLETPMRCTIDHMRITMKSQ